MSARDFYEFHDLGGTYYKLPRITSILNIIDKSNALKWWAANMERARIHAAVEEALTHPNVKTCQDVWDVLKPILADKGAFMRETRTAMNIGQQAHRLIHWHTLRMMGQAEYPEPGSDDNRVTAAVVAWLDWVKDVDFVPLHTEHFLWCGLCATAGTCDTIGKVLGKLTVVDYKTGKAIYDEAHLQTSFYQHMARRMGIDVQAAMILRLPKVETDPKFEAVYAKEIPHKYLVYVRGAWEWQQKMQGEETGSHTMQRCEP